MGELLTYKHAFNAGDLITVLPGMKHLYEQTGRKALIYQRLDLPADYGHNVSHPIQTDGIQVCMNKAMFDMLTPLIEAQEYVERFEIWQGEKVDFDFDLTRQNAQMPLPGGSIHHWATLIFPQLECDLSRPWLGAPARHAAFKTSTGEYDYIADKILINRTERYNNPYLNFSFLKEHEKKVLFIGTDREHATFCDAFGINIRRLFVNDFLVLAQALEACKFFIGNQSMCWHIADAMKIPRILEVCSQYPNTFPTGANGYSFITQQALEYRFNELLK